MTTVNSGLKWLWAMGLIAQTWVPHGDFELRRQNLTSKRQILTSKDGPRAGTFVDKFTKYNILYTLCANVAIFCNLKKINSFL